MQGNIAIDGPAGAGKSTVAKKLAKKLGYIYIDTGAMYRAITWKALKENINISNKSALAELAQRTEIVIKNIGDEQKIFCDGEDVTVDIRSPEVSKKVSLVAQVPGVRKRLQEIQKEMAKYNNVVMDGRDIATIVLPDAPYKFYLTASVQERAYRRHKELLGKGYKSDLESIQREISERDRLDQERTESPLMKAPEAIEIDTSKMTIKEVLNKIMQHLER
ncbi:MAG: CMP/dCMP kinase [Clostridia bacterium]|nr:CMP/dCMP kinase [Clostridia bacterium]